MIRAITLENFMSHGKTRIELADGLTVLTGPNNCGKSALVAALQCVAAGGKTTHVLRHGQKLCRVTVETDDGHVIIWERKKSTVKYNINGEDIHRTGQGIPDALHDVLKLDRVTTKVGASEEVHDIHFGQQKSPVFLLDQPGSKAAAFFASSSDAARLIEMQGRHRKQVSERRSEAKRIEKELVEVAHRVTGFDPVETLGGQVQIAEAKRVTLDDLSQKIGQLQKKIGALKVAADSRSQFLAQCKTLQPLGNVSTRSADLERRQSQVTKLRDGLRSARQVLQTREISTAICCCLNRLRPAPQLTETRSIRELITRMRQTQRDERRATEVRSRCAALREVPDLYDTVRFRAALSRLRSAIDSVRVSRALCDSIDGLRVPPQSVPTESLDQIIRRLRTAVTKRRCMRRVFEVFETLRPVGTPDDVQPLRRSIERLRPILQQNQAAEQAAVTARQNVDTCELAIREFVQANPKCQTCGGDIDPETLMSTLPDLHEHAAGTDGMATPSKREAI